MIDWAARLEWDNWIKRVLQYLEWSLFSQRNECISSKGFNDIIILLLYFTIFIIIYQIKLVYFCSQKSNIKIHKIHFLAFSDHNFCQKKTTTFESLPLPTIPLIGAHIFAKKNTTFESFPLSAIPCTVAHKIKQHFLEFTTLQSKRGLTNGYGHGHSSIYCISAINWIFLILCNGKMYF